MIKIILQESIFISYRYYPVLVATRLIMRFYLLLSNDTFFNIRKGFQLKQNNALEYSIKKFLMPMFLFMLNNPWIRKGFWVALSYNKLTLSHIDTIKTP